jgi:sterol desaturase/sphingolipid hydroxylase (fatty acid hydroxylase superfamily)
MEFTSETTLRFSVFLGVFLLMALWEVLTPRRQPVVSRPRRWLINLSLIVFNAFLVRLTVGALAFSAAILAREQGWGLFHYVSLPPWISMVGSLLILDFSIYLQHVVFHAVPLFWRLHRVHHADLDFDVTTGLRFHPLEILLSLVFKAAIILLIGAPPLAVVLFEMILNAASQFNHGNVSIPVKVDRWLRGVIVTPDMHRIHHSVLVDETNSNFGFSVSWWDRLCGTYKAEPEKGQTQMEIGLREFRNPKKLGLGNLMLLPFQGRLGSYSFQKNTN